MIWNRYFRIAKSSDMTISHNSDWLWAKFDCSCQIGNVSDRYWGQAHRQNGCRIQSNATSWTSKKQQGKTVEASNCVILKTQYSTSCIFVSVAVYLYLYLYLNRGNGNGKEGVVSVKKKKTLSSQTKREKHWLHNTAYAQFSFSLTKKAWELARKGMVDMKGCS